MTADEVCPGLGGEHVWRFSECVGCGLDLDNRYGVSDDGWRARSDAEKSLIESITALREAEQFRDFVNRRFL